MHLSAVLVLPEPGTVVAHEQSEIGEIFRARLPGSTEQGMSVEISSSTGAVLWKHDFGYNLSAPEGNEIQISCDSSLRLVLINYRGFHDHDHKLLLVESKHRQPVIREYKTEEGDILPILKRRKDFPEGYRYSIYPLCLIDHGVRFDSLPLQKPELHSIHPYAPDVRSYVVDATVTVDHRVVPTTVKTSQ